MKYAKGELKGDGEISTIQQIIQLGIDREEQAAALLGGDRGPEVTQHHRLQVLPGRAHQAYRRSLSPVRHGAGLRVQAGVQDRAADHWRLGAV